VIIPDVPTSLAQKIKLERFIAKKALNNNNNNKLND